MTLRSRLSAALALICAMAMAAPAQAQNSNAACGVPVPSSPAIPVLINHYEGVIIPTVTVAGQNGLTYLVDIDIAQDGPPLYLVTNSYEATIYRLQGNVARVEQVVALAGSSYIGIPDSKISFSTGRDCRLRETTYTSNKPGFPPQAAEFLARLTGKPVDAGNAAIISTYGMPNIAIGGLQGPDDKTVFADENSLIRGPLAVRMTLPPPPEKPSNGGFMQRSASMSQTEYWGQSFAPGSLVAIDPAQVITQGRAEPYETYPHYHGLRQLVNAGKLREIDIVYRKGYINAWQQANAAPYQHPLDPDFLPPYPGDGGMVYYVILDKLRIPSGLHGALSVSFLLPEGVPAPDGDLGHSSLVFMDPKAMAAAGKRHGGARYRPDQVVLKPVAEMEAAFGDDPVCRQLPMDARDHIVGVTLGNGRQMPDNRIAPIELGYDVPGQSRLILHAESQATGKVTINLAKGALLQDIVVLSDGYIDVSAPGLPSGAIWQKYAPPPANAGQKARQQQLHRRNRQDPCPLEPASRVVQGGPSVIALDHATRRATGAKLDEWHSFYPTRQFNAAIVKLQVTSKRAAGAQTAIEGATP